MTSTISETDIDWLTLIDFEQEQVCEWDNGCDKSAEWRYVLACCGQSFLYCGPHHLDIQQLLTQYGESSLADCLLCGDRHLFKNTYSRIHPV